MTPRKAAEFAKLWVNGPPHLRGDWIAVSKFLGFNYPPPLSDALLRRAIEAEGGKIPSLPQIAPSDFETIDHDTPDSAIHDAEYASQHVDSDPEGWKDMARRLRGIMESIAATGAVDGIKASAAQVSAIKTIFDRAEGRVADKSTVSQAPAGIVVIPGDEFVCPQCGYHV